MSKLDWIYNPQDELDFIKWEGKPKYPFLRLGERLLTEDEHKKHLEDLARKFLEK